MAFLPTNINWGKVGGVLDSKTGQLGLNTLFGTLANKGASDQLNQQQALQSKVAGQSRISDLYSQGQQDKLTRDQSMLSAAPTGWDQQYLQQQMAKYLSYDKLMKGGTTLPVINKDVQAKLDAAGYKPYTPQLGAGWETGENPYGRNLSEQSVLGRYNTLSQAAGGANYVPDFSKLFGAGANADYANQQASAFNKGQFENQYGKSSLLQQAIDGEKAQLAAAQQAQQQKSGGGFWSKFGSVLKVAAPIAASFIPGVGPLAAMAIGAGANAAGSKMQGASWGQALGSAGLGAGLSYLGNATFNKQPPSMSQFNAPGAASTASAQQSIGQGMNLTNPYILNGGFTGFSNPAQQAILQGSNPNLWAQMLMKNRG